MSELKRAPITTISEGSKEKSGSIRLDLRLFEPTLEEFPEFNYQALIHGEKKKRKKLSKVNGFVPNDPFDNDDDVEKIAKELEKKYGSNSSYTKKRSARIPGELCDKGAGYDESDSFIDNTEAYDELIPDEIETVRGGFYINSGPLEFQHLSNYERPEDAQRMPKPKKRALSTSSSSSDENDDREAKGDGAKNGHQEKNKIKTGDAKVARKIPKLASGGEKRNEPPPPPKVKTDMQDKDRLLKTTTVKDMLRAKRDNARNLQEAAQKDGDGVDLSSAPMTSESSNESTAIDMANGVKPEPKLPPNLNEELLRNIILLKEVVKVSTSMGKTIFSDTKVQELLLKIENATRSAGGHARNQVYSYLAAHLPCTKQTLMLHAKKMRIQQEEARVDKAVARLKRGIDDAMPGVLEAYKKEYERVVQLKSSMAIMGIPENENDPKMPKKQFAWTDVTRGLLNGVISTCQATFSTIKSRKVTFEDYIADCLTTKVLPIWPQGWMKMEGLLKEMDVKGRVPSKDVEAKIPPSTKAHVEKVDAKPSATIPPPVATTSFACSSSLTITPVSSNAPPAKPLPSVQNKVTITNIDKPTLPAVVAPHLPSGLSISLTSSSSPTPPNTQSATKSAPRSPPKEATPPPKKSFDYSISSIISSTSTALPAAPIVTVEPERSATDEKVKAKNESIAPQVVKNRPAPSVVEKTTNAIIEELSSTTSETDSDTDSSSDCEIIENSPNAKKKTMPAPPSKTTIIRPPKASSSSAAAQIKRELDPLSITNDNDIDVNQIMKELKELQEFQQVNSRAASGYTGKKTSESSEYSIGTLDAARLNELKRNLTTQQLVNHHPQLQDEMIFHEITEAVISSVRK